MSQLALASLDASTGPSARWAHDVRNALATVGLHLETLERLSGSRGREVAHAAHLLMLRAAAMCTEAMAGARPEAVSRRKPFDIARTIVQTASLLRPTVPAGFEIRIAGSAACAVEADQQEVFRILFNLVHNAIAVARQQRAGGRMTHVTLLTERTGTTVTVRVTDDGPACRRACARICSVVSNRPPAAAASGLRSRASWPSAMAACCATWIRRAAQASCSN